MNSTSSVLLPLYWYDYVSFSTMLVFCIMVSVYFGYIKQKQMTWYQFLFGNKNMSPFPIALSVAVGHFSAITLMACSADVYKYGIFTIYLCVSHALSAVFVLLIYYPVLFKCEVMSIFEYIEIRFDKKTKLLMTVMYVISDILFLAIVAYTPAMAFALASGINVSLVTAAITGICVFYVAIGGLKTVVWTDFVQLFIIFIVLALIAIIGTSSIGFSTIWHQAAKGERLAILDFDFDITKRDSFWTFIIGATFQCISGGYIHQSGLQKFLALPEYRQCKKSVIYSSSCLILVYMIVSYMGLLFYGQYGDCDPVLSHKIMKNDQILPLYVTEIGNYVPGFSGVFMITIFCAAFSTLSCSLNALSGVIHKDLLQGIFKLQIKDTDSATILKVIVGVTGAIVIVLTVGIEHFGDIGPLGISAQALFCGPSLGIITLGILFPITNATGAFYGSIVGSIFTAFLSFPLKFYFSQNKFTYPSKPLSVEGCKNLTIDLIQRNFTQIKADDLPPKIFRISHYYHNIFGALATIIFALIVSFATRRNSKKIDKKLISPLIARFSKNEYFTKNEKEMETLVKK